MMVVQLRITSGKRAWRLEVPLAALALSIPPNAQNRTARLKERSVSGAMRACFVNLSRDSLTQYVHTASFYSHVKDLEGRSAMLDQVMVDLAETNRRFEECRHMVDALRSENQRLTAALQQYTGGQLPPGFAQPAYPSDAPPPAENEVQTEANPAVIMHHAPPIESISHPSTNNEPEAPAAQSGTEDGGTQDDAGRKSKRSKR
jgi:hypothetical protein